MSNTLLETDEEMRRRIERRVHKRSEFNMHALAFGVVVAAMWAAFLALNLINWWWIVVAVTLGWASGLAAHAIETWFETGRPANRLDEALWREMRDRYGDDWRTDARKKDYEETRLRLRKPVDKIRELLMHGAVFIIINVLFWVTWFIGLAPLLNQVLHIDLSGVPVPLVITLGWGIGMVFHIADVVTSTNHVQAVENAVEKERERMARAEGKAKRKNDEQAAMRLGDDGELIEIIDDDEPMLSKSKRG